MLNYIINDARNTEEKFTDSKLKSPRLIITSPPYFNLKDYGGIPKQIGPDQSYDEYLVDVISVFQQCYKISKKDASLWVVIDTFKRNGETTPLPFDLLNKLKSVYGKSTWLLKDIVIWHKTKNTPWHTEGRLRNHFEYILFFAKGEKFLFNIDSIRESRNYKKWWLTYPERYNSNGKSITNIWEHSAPIRGWGNSGQNHMCSLPFGLLEKIIELSSNEGDVVFDPFGGSGSAIALASMMKREGIAFDINSIYKKLFTTEVISAAQHYWEKRTVEKEVIYKENKEFKLQNLALRKLKSTFLLLNSIDKRRKFKVILTTQSSISNKLTITLFISIKNKNLVQRKIKSAKLTIEKSMKTEVEIKLVKSLGFQRKLDSQKKWFVYDSFKFYKLVGRYSSKEINGLVGIISNINLSVSLKSARNS